MGPSRLLIAAALALPLAALGASGDLAAQSRGPSLSGSWQLEKANIKTNGPKIVIIRADSSASWGTETVRWRLKGDDIWIAIGGEWEIYKIRVRGTRMTLSGGDLTEPITLRRTGPATARPDSVPIPPDPDVAG